VKLNSCIVKENTSAVTSHGGGNYAIHNAGTMILNSSSVTNNECAILNNLGTLTLNRSTVSNNTPYSAIDSTGRLLVNESTVSNNSSTFIGGGIHSYQPPGTGGGHDFRGAWNGMQA
jgi:hypothetical protein